MLTGRSNGSREADICKLLAQPARIGSGEHLASSGASTALVPTGRSTAAAMVRIATSPAIIGSARTGTPSVTRTITSIGVESTWTC
ncbi:hypothetical protein [Amycolatopsis sp. DG1A-15b]|uniref:hypothetical protein n=1 Tax=Amycolatopsis sp. DG1A-15b TaxID=3052846 RepID=UPI00255BEE1E|nr:hypothetical protein [Amycolatopsis sp. DG1A-15b]WIX92571.1 hypothetical protein QRY02_19865 [Amycolatopsis sp. DG1A-15b]